MGSRYISASGASHKNLREMNGCDRVGPEMCLVSFFIRVKGERRETGEEEDGGERENDPVGGVSGEEEGEEESKEERNEGEEGMFFL